MEGFRQDRGEGICLRLEEAGIMNELRAPSY